jgi:hypothetical protein
MLSQINHEIDHLTGCLTWVKVNGAFPARRGRALRLNVPNSLPP